MSSSPTNSCSAPGFWLPLWFSSQCCDQHTRCWGWSAQLLRWSGRGRGPARKGLSVCVSEAGDLKSWRLEVERVLDHLVLWFSCYFVGSLWGGSPPRPFSIRLPSKIWFEERFWCLKIWKWFDLIQTPVFLLWGKTASGRHKDLTRLLVAGINSKIWMRNILSRLYFHHLLVLLGFQKTTLDKRLC